MVNQLVLTFIFLVGIAFLLVFIELTYRRLGLTGEFTRKFAHFTATLSTVVFPYIFQDHWYVLALSTFFFVILYISKNGTQLKSIHDIARKSVGSYLLPIAIYLTFLVSVKLENRFLYILPILILAISDPIAGILGLNIRIYNHQIIIFGNKLKKTYIGTGAFFISSFIISVVALYFNRTIFDLKTFWLAMGIAIVSTFTELFSVRGIDNLLIPVSVMIMLLLFL